MKKVKDWNSQQLSNEDKFETIKLLHMANRQDLEDLLAETKLDLADMKEERRNIGWRIAGRITRDIALLAAIGTDASLLVNLITTGGVPTLLLGTSLGLHAVSLLTKLGLRIEGEKSNIFTDPRNIVEEIKDLWELKDELKETKKTVKSLRKIISLKDTFGL